MAKLKAILDNKATWATIGMFAGSLFGARVADIINAVGSAVMVIL